MELGLPEPSVCEVHMSKILIILGAIWLGFSLYSSNFAINIEFWSALLPVSYALALLLLITSK